MLKTILGYSLLAIYLFSTCKKDEPGVKPLTTDRLVVLSAADFRPAYHFTPPSEWMNDPNGLVFYEGEFHLFYQYNPVGIVWGPMNWGHAVSTDLFNWKDLPIALTPDNLGTIFSGSAVVDSTNTSGFKTNNESPLISIFTENGNQQVQSIAYSIDKGRSWTKFINNPVLPNPGYPNFRDPKVIWFPSENKWIMVITIGTSINIYSSIDLKSWTFESNFSLGSSLQGGVCECPDLFQLPVTGTNLGKWVLMISLSTGAPNGGTGTEYFIGDFDGKTFSADNSTPLWIDYGTDNYAGSTYNDIPSTDGRRIFIGWMSNWNYAGLVPATTWRSTMTVPRVITLANNGQGLSLKFNPVDELKTYLSAALDTTIQAPLSQINLLNNKIIETGSYELNFSLDFSKSNAFKLTVGNDKEHLIVNFDKLASYVYIDRSLSGQTDFNSQFSQKIYCPYVPKSNQLTDIQILIDKTSIELFIDHGDKVMTSLFFPVDQYNSLNIQGDNVSAQISNFNLQGLNKSLLR